MNEWSWFQPQKAEKLVSFEQVVLDLESRIQKKEVLKSPSWLWKATEARCGSCVIAMETQRGHSVKL